jgi:hypothetical protein
MKSRTDEQVDNDTVTLLPFVVLDVIYQMRSKFIYNTELLVSSWLLNVYTRTLGILPIFTDSVMVLMYGTAFEFIDIHM